MSSTKQAELRRLMKLQRQRKQQQEPAAPKEVSSGILKKPGKSILKTGKRMTAQSMKPEEETQEQPICKTGVAVLVSGYSSSSSDGEPEQPQQQRAIRFVQPKITTFEEKHVQDDVSRIEPRSAGNSTKNDVAVAQQPELASAATSVHRHEDPSLSLSTKNGTTAATESSDVARQDAIAHDVDPETWKEFEALVDDDEGGGNDNKKAPFAHNDDALVAMENPSVASTGTAEEEMTAQSQTTIETPSIDANEVEQASYEARLARLRMKALSARKKRKRNHPQTTTMEDDVPSYTPNLAFQQNQEDENQRSEDSENNNKVISHLEILRQKRAKRRQLYGTSMEANDLK